MNLFRNSEFEIRESPGRWSILTRLRPLPAALVLAGLLAIYHVSLVWLMRHGDLELGVVRPSDRVWRLVPLYMHWRPHFKLGLPVAIVLLLTFVAWFSRFAWTLRISTWRLIPLLMVGHVGIACSVAMIDGGPGRLARPYEAYIGTNYFGAVDQVDSPREFLRDYVRLVPDLPMHCQTHPPGAVLFLWGAGRLLGSTAMAAALATIVASSLTIPAAYGLAREVLGEAPSRLAMALLMLSPSFVLFSATCMDAVFCVPMVWTAFLVAKARRIRPWLYGAAAGVCGVLAAMCTFSAVFVVLWSALLLLLAMAPRIGGDRVAVRNLAVAGCSAVAVASGLFLALEAWSGFNIVTMYQAAADSHQRIMAGVNHHTWRQHVHLSVANLAAFFTSAGLATTVLWGGHLLSVIRGQVENMRLAQFTLSFAIALLVIDAAPLYTLEVEHIWLFMIPFVAIGAAAQLTALWADLPTGPPTRLPTPARLTLLCLAAQLILMETLLHTMW